MSLSLRVMNMGSGRTTQKAVIIIGASISVLLAMVAAVNQLVGFVSAISIATAVTFTIIGISFAIAGTSQIRKRTGMKRLTSRISVRMFVRVIAVLVICIGIIPFTTKWALAENAEAEGYRKADMHLYAAARNPLKRAERYFDDIGFGGKADAIRVRLVDTYSELGDRSQADQMIEKLEESVLSEKLWGQLLITRANMEYQRGHYILSEKFYQQAHGVVEPGSADYAVLLHNEALSWAQQGGKYQDRARDNLRKALEIWEQLGDKVRIAYVLSVEGDLEQDPSAARWIYEQALAIAEEAKLVQLVGSLNHNIAITYRLEGNFELADQYYDRALLHFEQVADLTSQALLYANRSVLEEAQGRHAVASKYLEQSESYLRNMDPDDPDMHPRLIADIQSRLGLVYDGLGESTKAEGHYQAALGLFSEYPYPLWEAETLVNYGAFLAGMNRDEEALQQFARAREILEAFGHGEPVPLLGMLENNLAVVYEKRGDYQSALDRVMAAAEILEHTGNRLLYAQAIENVGQLESILGMDGESKIRQALEIYREIGNRNHEVLALYNLYLRLPLEEKPSGASELLALLSRYDIDHSSEVTILLGISPDYIESHDDRVVFRERLRQLNLFFQEQNMKVELGLSLVQLAGLEHKMKNEEDAVKYLREAEEYVNLIPLPRRISYHGDLGDLLIELSYPNEGIAHYWHAYELWAAGSLTGADTMAKMIAITLLEHWEMVDLQRQLELSEHAIEITADPDTRTVFELIVTAINDPSNRTTYLLNALSQVPEEEEEEVVSPETGIPPHFTTYTEATGIFSLSYPSDWETALWAIDGLEQSTKELLTSIESNLLLERAFVIFFAGLPVETGYSPNVNILVESLPDITWHDEMVEAEIRGIKLVVTDYRELSRVNTRVDGRVATILEWEGTYPELGEMAVLQMFTLTVDIVWVISCTPPSGELSKYEDDFNAIVKSFRLLVKSQ